MTRLSASTTSVPMSDYDQAVQALAALAGIAVNWIDAYQQPQVVSAASLRTILASLGLPCDSLRQTQDSMAQLQTLQQPAALAPLMTAESGQPLALPMGGHWHGRSAVITLESGRTLHCQVSTSLDQEPFINAPEEIGYHRLQMGDVEVTLAVAPARCYGVRDALAASVGDSQRSNAWGLAAQLYGLRSDGDAGIGHFGSLAELAEAAAGEAADALAMSPVHALFSADPGRCSPYSPSSRLFHNVLHIDPNALLGPAAVQQVLADAGAEVTARHQRLQQASQIPWPEAGAHRLLLLRHLYAKYRQQERPTAELAAFRRQGGQALHDHAVFEALHHHLRSSDATIASDWRQWPQQWQQPQAATVRAFAADESAQVDFHIFLQWQAARGLQLAQQRACAGGMAIGLIADLAVGADNGGSQTWSHRSEMITGLSVGAPPDQLNARGQNWGIGAFSPLAMRAEGYRSYIAMLRAAFAHAGGVRIDHVMGLTRLWLTPEGADAKHGAYLRYPARDLLRLVALESWRHRAIVIGEDLGTVPPGFDGALKQTGLLGIGVLLFQRQSQAGLAAAPFLAPAQWSPDAIATTSTHDLPPLAGWWKGCDIDWRSRLDLLPPGVSEAQTHSERQLDRSLMWQALLEAACVSGAVPGADAPQAVIDGAAAFVAATPAPLTLLPLEDLLGLEQQPNLPGTVADHPNWQRRVPVASSDLLSQTDCRRRLRLLQHGRLQGAALSRAGKIAP